MALGYNQQPITGYAETKTVTNGGFVDVIGPATESKSNPALLSGVPSGQTVTKINIDRNSIVIGVGGYMCPKPE